MDIRLFARYIQDAQEHDFYDTARGDFLKDNASCLFKIRDSYTHYKRGKEEIEDEKKQPFPNLTKIANIRMRIAAKTRDASMSMIALNNETTKRFGRQLFDYSGGLYTSPLARTIIRKDSKEYSEQLNERVGSLVPEEMLDTEFADRVFAESYLWEEHFQERDRSYEDFNLDEPPTLEIQQANQDLDTTPTLVRPVSEPDIDETSALETTKQREQKQERKKNDTTYTQTPRKSFSEQRISENEERNYEAKKSEPDRIRFHTKAEFDAFLNSNKNGGGGNGSPGGHDTPDGPGSGNSGPGNDDLDI